jgi:hypothetical protein
MNSSLKTDTANNNFWNISINEILQVFTGFALFISLIAFYNNNVNSANLYDLFYIVGFAAFAIIPLIILVLNSQKLGKLLTPTYIIIATVSVNYLVLSTLNSLLLGQQYGLAFVIVVLFYSLCIFRFHSILNWLNVVLSSLLIFTIPTLTGLLAYPSSNGSTVSMIPKWIYVGIVALIGVVGILTANQYRNKLNNENN